MHNDKRSVRHLARPLKLTTKSLGVEIQCENQDWSLEASEKSQIEGFYRGFSLIRLGETEITKEHDLAQ